MMMRKPRALVVDDDRSWQEILREILEDSGCEVDTAASLDEAQRLMAVPHRVAVVDLALHERDHHNRDGLMVLKLLREHDPGCSAILLTGYATVELAVSAIRQYGAENVLRKEVFTRGELKKLLLSIFSAEEKKPEDTKPTVTLPQLLKVNREARILLVEDDQSWQDILSELLGESGFQVRACRSFGEALGCLRRERYQLAIIDLSLSHASGGGGIGATRPEDLEGYRLLLGFQGGGTPVIVLSGMTDPVLIEQTFARPQVFAYLEKQSFHRKVFLRTVHEALQQKGPPAEFEKLTEREREVLELLAEGKTNKEIAEALVITTNTVKRHLKSIFAKLEIHTRAAAVARIKGET
ncbi:response regulator containing a CheY-like receiver domain and an HTH DNA-binding domain [Anaerolinea thermolimosa]|uniref:response regulator n=1 Tax=Anaerolinea thermolimosa TaxID=229919 RepID=UPI0009FF8FF7|nr:response regulator [Anaerolinea thermolimosa]GAP05944.1 response regulator containing a CheY-like receiver domain and an HTH DNA-binding domain [Anaerolinea thermolimosa]